MTVINLPPGNVMTLAYCHLSINLGKYTVPSEHIVRHRVYSGDDTNGTVTTAVISIMMLGPESPVCWPATHLISIQCLRLELQTPDVAAAITSGWLSLP